MTTDEILKADVIDILFENRNKQYGAYELRKHYDQRLLLSLLLTFSGIFLVVLLIKPGGKSASIALPEEPSIVVRTTVIPIKKIPPKKPEVMQPTSQQKIAQVKSTSQIKIVEDIHVIDLLPTQKDLIDAIPGNMNSTGLAYPVMKINPGPSIISSGGTTVSTTEKTQVTKPITKQPEFPGGTEAWISFLQRHLRVPDELESGEKITVLISFLVDVDGSVTGFKVLRSGGKIYDNEVIRVLKKMPRWNPAISNGLAVNTSFNQPVTFVAVEQ